MADTPGKKSATKRTTRNSLSCAQCRYKHVRCDGQKPICTRCETEAKECVYLPSRRRGNPKVKHSTYPAEAPVPESSIESSLDSHFQASNTSPSSSTAATGETEASLNFSSQYLALYYDSFHAAHPCILPLHALKQRLIDPTIQPLLRVLCYVGSIFDSSRPSEIWYQWANDAVSEIRLTTRSLTTFDIQAVLLFAIVVYWCNEPERGVELLDETIRMAVSIGMNKKEYSRTYGYGDPLLEESLRRTWWVIYITDAHIAGSTHTYPFRTSGTNITTDLPCEEDDYETGNIPLPRSIEDYENREFFTEYDSNFSSYAELIGLTLGIDRALSPGSTTDSQLYIAMASASDTCIRAWYSLLPPSKRDPIRPDGSVDEVMFKALFIMHTYTVEIHRPLSALTHSAIESVSRCAPMAPSEQLKCNNAKEKDLHTLKCTTAIDSIDELLTLPTNMKSHSPFIICMIANLAIAHLSACRFIYHGQRLSQSREKIRLMMGTLKHLSEHWVLGKRTYREIGIVARELLSLAKDAPVNFPTFELALPNPPSMDIPALDMLPDGNFDFCAFFDAGTSGVNEPDMHCI
ncbi:uncharacterized protein N7511_003157 [Penicillium nucicola]|uniref:uncharacterized protein n=1 Tax=Penicillium nucicola TaxID=1850975 RepID=UPI0025456924|nr:uncharacterized protein N7511_003157 [Penicillium nucicola]KAJ5771106.1 hypothetical protein N7511_003157 [Penicillium nucicola]